MILFLLLLYGKLIMLYFKVIYIDNVFIFFLLIFGWKCMFFFVGLIVLLCCVW